MILIVVFGIFTRNKGSAVKSLLEKNHYVPVQEMTCYLSTRSTFWKTQAVFCAINTSAAFVYMYLYKMNYIVLFRFFGELTSRP